MKKVKAITFILIALLIIIFPLTINATQDGGKQIDPTKYSSDGPSESDVESMYKFGGSIAGIIQIVGTAVSAGAMIIMGIKYVIASADEKAEYRERMIPYFIGAVLLFGASNVVALADKMIN